MGHKLISILIQLLLFLFKLILGISVLGILWIVLTNILINIGVLIPANYSEAVLEQNKVKLLSLDEITSADLPTGCKFAVFDYKYNVKYGNMDESENQYAINMLKGNESSLLGNSIYFSILRENDICVVKYNVKAYLSIPNSNEEILNYDYISCICLVGVLASYIYNLVHSLVRGWKLEFQKIEEMALEIEKNNLDFEYKKSNIREFQHIIKSIINMREALKETLYMSWEIENEKVEQIGALVHDIKIPLTIIKGNTELMIDYNKDLYNSTHLHNSLEAIHKIENYILLLLHYVKAEHIDEINTREIETAHFTELIRKEIEKYIMDLDIEFQINIGYMRGRISLDYFLMERAILNIVDNAIQYRTENDKIVCCFEEDKGKYVCSISNQFGKFDKEVMQNANKLFYTSDKSRNSLHYGIGLAYVKKAVHFCNGTVDIYNCKKNGATVKIQLPLLV